MRCVDLRENCKGGVSNQTSGHAVQGIELDGDVQSRSNLDQNTIDKRVHSPHIRSPVRMAQTSREWEQPLLELEELAPVRKRP